MKRVAIDKLWLVGAAVAAVLALAGALSASGCSRSRSQASGPAAIGPVLTPGPADPADQTEAAPPAGSADPLVVMTYNVNFGLAGDEDTLAALRSAQADLVVLEEVTPEWQRSLEDRVADRYPHRLYRAARAAGGLAVLSRWPLEDGDLTASPVGWFPGWRVLAETPLGKLQLLALHLRPPLSDRRAPFGGYFSTAKDRRAEIEAYWKTIDPALPVLALGDFNEDQSGSAVGFLHQRKLRDALPADTMTWRWNTGAGPIQWQLDHILYDETFTLVSAEVVNAGRSDHLPVIARLRLK